jgi:hypothetical protein
MLLIPLPKLLALFYKLMKPLETPNLNKHNKPVEVEEEELLVWEDFKEIKL